MFGFLKREDADAIVHTQHITNVYAESERLSQSVIASSNQATDFVQALVDSGKLKVIQQRNRMNAMREKIAMNLIDARGVAIGSALDAALQEIAMLKGQTLAQVKTVSRAGRSQAYDDDILDQVKRGELTAEEGKFALEEVKQYQWYIEPAARSLI